MTTQQRRQLFFLETIIVMMTLILFLCGSFGGAMAAASQVVREETPVVDSAQGVFTIPLLPHSVVAKRRLLERQNDAASFFSNIDPSTTHSGSIDTVHKNANNNIDGNNDVRRRRDDVTADPEAQEVASLFLGKDSHYVDLWCGTPPQRQTMIVATASPHTAFPCRECRGCGVPKYHTDPVFDQNKSTTFRKVSCNDCFIGAGTCGTVNECYLHTSYQEGSSWKAYESLDRCYIGGLHNRPLDAPQDTDRPGDNDDIDPLYAQQFAFDLRFGCQTEVTGLFVSQLADGIMGMDNSQSSFISQMYKAKKIANKVFSLCFSHPSTAERNGTEAGAMSLGGSESRLHETPMVFTDVNSYKYPSSVHVRKMYLRKGGGGRSAHSTDPQLQVVQLNISEYMLNAGRVTIDSGTTDTYLSSNVKNEFKRVFHMMTGKIYFDDTYYPFTSETLAQQPTILFQITGNKDLNGKVLNKIGTGGNVVGLAGDLDPHYPLDIILAIPPEHYYEYVAGRGYVSRVYLDESNGSVLGANAMTGHDISFDYQRLLIGFAESSCNYTSLIATHSDDDVEIPKSDLDSGSVGPAAESKSVTTNITGTTSNNYTASVATIPRVSNSTPPVGEVTGKQDIDTAEQEAESSSGGPFSGTEDAPQIQDDDGYEEGETYDPDDDIGDKSSFDGEQTGTYDFKEAGDGTCTGLTCQGLILVGIVAAVVFVAYRAVRGVPSEPTYDFVESELELQAVDRRGNGYQNMLT